LLGNKSVKSNIFAALLGGAAGYGGGHYLYHKFLNDTDLATQLNNAAYDHPGKIPYQDKATGETRYIYPQELMLRVVDYADKFESDDPTARYDAASKWAQDTFGFSPDARDIKQAHLSVRQAKTMGDAYKAWEKDPYSVITDAPIAWLKKGEEDHGKRLDELDDFMARVYKPSTRGSTHAWYNGGYLGTGMTEAEVTAAARENGIQSNERMSAILIYSRLCKDIGTSSIAAQHLNKGKPLNFAEVDYLAYNSMPHRFRKQIPLGFRMISAERAAATNGWSYELDYEGWSNPWSAKSRISLTDASDRLNTFGYLAGTAATGGSGWWMTPVMLDSVGKAVLQSNLPRYTSQHTRDSAWYNPLAANERNRDAAVRILSDPVRVPQYGKFGGRVWNLNATDMLDSAADTLDLTMDLANFARGNLGPVSYLFQTATNGFNIYDRNNQIVYRNSLKPGNSPYSFTDVPSYRALWEYHNGRPANQYGVK
jgi:hypothetical protein